jgi:SAM-dependent methyltransferase
MPNRSSNAWWRLRRSVAQRGLASALLNLAQRLRSRNLAPTPVDTLNRDVDHPFDQRTGLDTAGYIHGSQLETGHAHDLYSTAYYGSAPSLVQAVLDRWRQTPGVRPIEDYTFIDFGSGKGRVVLLAAQLPFRRCIGVEINPELSRIAARNMERWQQIGNTASPMEAICSEATEFVFPDSPCVLYLFNPFKARVLSRLLDRIAFSFAQRPGELDLLYVNAESNSILEKHPGFERLWEMPIAMSEEDANVDLLYLADESGKKQYGVAGQEPCCAWRWTAAPQP